MGEQTTGTATVDRASGAGSLELRAPSVTLTVDDIDRSLRFYVDGLGFTVKERWEEEGKLLGVMLTAGECEIGLSQDDWKKGRDREKGIGFSLHTQTGQDLGAIAERAREHGADAVGPREQWGSQVLS